LSIFLKNQAIISGVTAGIGACLMTTRVAFQIDKLSHCGRKGLFIQMTLFTHAIKGAFISLPGGLSSCFMPHVLNLMWGVADNDAHYSKL
jgi:hypothetical protein